MKTFWLSFANNEGNLGVIITRSKSEKTVIQKVKKMGIAPLKFNDVLIFEMPNEGENDLPFDKLLTPEYLRTVGYLSTKERKIKAANN